MKFISSNYDSETGLSVVVIRHMNINFMGSARLHPEDKPFGSTYMGCTLAEIRATIKALKFELEWAKLEEKHCKSLLNSCISCKNFNKYSKSSKVLFRQYNRRVKRVQDIKNEIKDLKKQEKAIIDNRAKYIKKRHEEAMIQIEELSK